jgi:hypothetical protein
MGGAIYIIAPPYIRKSYVPRELIRIFLKKDKRKRLILISSWGATTNFLI